MGTSDPNMSPTRGANDPNNELERRKLQSIFNLRLEDIPFADDSGDDEDSGEDLYNARFSAPIAKGDETPAIAGIPGYDEDLFRPVFDLGNVPSISAAVGSASLSETNNNKKNIGGASRPDTLPIGPVVVPNPDSPLSSPKQLPIFTFGQTSPTTAFMKYVRKPSDVLDESNRVLSEGERSRSRSRHASEHSLGLKESKSRNSSHCSVLMLPGVENQMFSSIDEYKRQEELVLETWQLKYEIGELPSPASSFSSLDSGGSRIGRSLSKSFKSFRDFIRRDSVIAAPKPVAPPVKQPAKKRAGGIPLASILCGSQRSKSSVQQKYHQDSDEDYAYLPTKSRSGRQDSTGMYSNGSTPERNRHFRVHLGHLEDRAEGLYQGDLAEDFTCDSSFKSGGKKEPEEAPPPKRSFLLLSAPVDKKRLPLDKDRAARRKQLDDFCALYPGLQCEHVFKHEVYTYNDLKTALRQYMREDASRAIFAIIIFNGHGNKNGLVLNKSDPVPLDKFIKKVRKLLSEQQSVGRKPHVVKIVFAQCHGHKYTQAEHRDIQVVSFTSDERPTTQATIKFDRLTREVASSSHAQLQSFASELSLHDATVDGIVLPRGNLTLGNGKAIDV